LGESEQPLLRVRKKGYCATGFGKNDPRIFNAGRWPAVKERGHDEERLRMGGRPNLKAQQGDLCKAEHYPSLAKRAPSLGKEGQEKKDEPRELDIINSPEKGSILSPYEKTAPWPSKQVNTVLKKKKLG